MNQKLKSAIFLLVIILAGVASGRFLSSSTSGSSTPTQNTNTEADQAGSDNEIYNIEVEGVLEEGGIEGEGNFHLVRGSGPEQYAYLYSTAIDLSPFVGKKVKVRGETVSAVHAPWLMDVGKIQVVK